MRPVPAHVVIDPVPHDFDPPISDDGQVIRWVGSIGGQRYVLGLRPSRTTAAVGKAREDLRYGVWQLYELHRLERPDLMRYAHEHRHPPKSQRARPG